MAKPAIITYCQRYEANTASRRFHLRRLVSRSLELALAASDWTAVEAARARLRSLDAEAAAGLAIRTHSPLADQEEPAAFHHQQETQSCPGGAPGQTYGCIRSAVGWGCIPPPCWPGEGRICCT